jgi:hypothetical protein
MGLCARGCSPYYCLMRYKGLSVCLVVLVVFFGLRFFMQTVEPQPPSHLAMLEGGTRAIPSGNHLASLASLAAGALAFAVIPGRKRSMTEKTAPGKATSDKPAPQRVVQEPVVRCPQCDNTMSRVIINNGEHRGRAVWLCPQSPDCEVRPLTRRRRLPFIRRQAVGF